jgi:nitroreductase
MGASAGRVAVLSAFLILGMILAGVLFQPKASVEAWDVNESHFSDLNTTDGRLKFLLNYAILAPSTYNSQPWKFNVSGSEIKVIADKSRWQQISDADKRELYLSLGCAIENLLIAADHFGYQRQVKYFPNSTRDDLVASVIFNPGGKPSDSMLFNAISASKTSTKPFEDRAVSEKDLQVIMNSSSIDGVDLYMTSDPEAKSRFRDLVLKADQSLYLSQDYKSELGYWLGQGVMGPTGIQAKIAQMNVLFLDTGSDQARNDAEIVNSTAALGFISTEGNDKSSQIRAGQLLERIWLTATSMGMQIHPMGQALEVSQTKAELKGMLPQNGLYPQQAFCLGYASSNEDPLSRRPLKDVLA